MAEGKPRIRFYDQVDESLIVYALVPCTYKGQWVWVFNKKRGGLEFPAGHVEPGEHADATARRELEEETGTRDYRIWPVSYYSVSLPEAHGAFSPEQFGRLYYAELMNLGKPDPEIDRLVLSNEMPGNLSFPDIQPILLRHVTYWREAHKP
ncbi:MAG: NUDIX domain-containing protein [Eubacteriales bacterium]|nr:NUDIX domain-containing protein [Eubacteriales bacterium]